MFIKDYYLPGSACLLSDSRAVRWTQSGLREVAVIFLNFIWLYLVLVGQHVGSSVFVATCRNFSCGKQDLVPWLWMEPGPPALGAQSLSHWITREVPRSQCHLCSRHHLQILALGSLQIVILTAALKGGSVIPIPRGNLWCSKSPGGLLRIPHLVIGVPGFTSPSAPASRPLGSTLPVCLPQTVVSSWGSGPALSTQLADLSLLHTVRGMLASLCSDAWLSLNWSLLISLTSLRH